MDTADPDDERLDSTNRDFIRFDQVEKPQTYGLAEGMEASEEFDEEFRVQILDLAPALHGTSAERAAFGRSLREALEEIGFAVLTGHGIAPSLYDACESEVPRVFTEHSLEEKLRYRAAPHGSVNQGYFPKEETTDIHPDQVEGWVFCRRAFDLDPDLPLDVARFWPAASHERIFRRLALAQEGLILPIMRALLVGLDLPPDLFDERLTRTNFALRLNYYPPVPAGVRAARLLGHEDVNLFTLLPAPRSEGLQVLNRANFRWVRLEAPPGSIILNTGDYMQRITNDVLPSTTHRVSAPRDAAQRSRSRVSFPMNVYLWEDEILEVLPGLGEAHYEPVRAMDFHRRITSKYYGEGYTEA